MEKENKVTLENGLEVTGATLLTAEEAVKLSKETRAIGCWWWLRSPGNVSDYPAVVLSDGSVDDDGLGVNGISAVRPALIFDLKSSDLGIGDVFRFGSRDFEIISDTRALCTENIGYCAFREDRKAPDANDYEASDIKEFVEEWYTEQTNTFAAPGSPVSESSKTLTAAEIKETNPVTLENGLTVKGATLLTAKEAERLPKETRAIGCWWWLRSPGYSSNYAANVLSDGSVDCGGGNVYGTDAVRPALMISNLESSNLRIGDKFRFGGKDFEIISDIRALCMERIGKCAFREDWKADDANDYETSDIRKFIEEWYQEQMNALTTPASSTTVPSETLPTSETDDNWEMRYKDEQIKELREMIAGVITEKGCYNMADRKWEINTSSILTRLIQEAGRWCSFYASDLFILWKYNIDEKLDNGTLDTGTFVFAFREGGVDNKTGYERNKENPHYYRSVWFLDVTVGEGKITMKLHKSI